MSAYTFRSVVACANFSSSEAFMLLALEHTVAFVCVIYTSVISQTEIQFVAGNTQTSVSAAMVKFRG